MILVNGSRETKEVAAGFRYYSGAFLDVFGGSWGESGVIWGVFGVVSGGYSMVQLALFFNQLCVELDIGTAGFSIFSCFSFRVGSFNVMSSQDR
jgi:hypothetical protein